MVNSQGAERNVHTQKDVEACIYLTQILPYTFFSFGCSSVASFIIDQSIWMKCLLEFCELVKESINTIEDIVGAQNLLLFDQK